MSRCECMLASVIPCNKDYDDGYADSATRIRCPITPIRCLRARRRRRLLGRGRSGFGLADAPRQLPRHVDADDPESLRVWGQRV